MPVCSRCGENKPPNLFHVDPTKSSGYRSNCKACQNATSRAYDQSHKEENKQRSRQWYEKNKAHVREKNREYTAHHRERIRESQRAWASEHRENIREQGRRAWRILREETLAAYGAQCRCCGESAIAFLSIDHINGQGSKHRREEIVSHNTCAWLKRNGWPPGFQILCYNCNQAKHLYGECPHISKATPTERGGRSMAQSEGSGPEVNYFWE